MLGTHWVQTVIDGSGVGEGAYPKKWKIRIQKTPIEQMMLS